MRRGSRRIGARLPAGAIKVSYEIQSVSRNASKRPVMVFRMLQNGAPVPFKTFNPDTMTFPLSTQEIWDNFFGSPSAQFVYAVPQDGIAAPADFNAAASGYLRSIWNGTASGSGAGTLTGPDASGFYTVTLTGVTIPDNAVMLSGGVGFSYALRSTPPLTQTNLPNYPVTPSSLPVSSVVPISSPELLDPRLPNKRGGLIVIVPNVTKVATNYTARRPIVEDARCNKCHQELGTFTDDVVPRRATQRRHHLRVVPHAQPHQQRLVGGLDQLSSTRSTVGPSARCRSPGMRRARPSRSPTSSSRVC